MITLNVNSLENAEIFWRELGLDNEIALNETFDPAPQILAIPVTYLDEIHDKVLELDLPNSPIVPTADGKFMFSFVAPEGNTFIIIGDWVEEPYSGAKRDEFFENMKNVEVLTPAALSNLTEEAFILFGRVTCPWTRYFSRQLPALSGVKIYYIDTEDTDLNPELQALRAQYQAPTVPTFIKRQADGSFVKFDKSQQSLPDFCQI